MAVVMVFVASSPSWFSWRRGQHHRFRRVIVMVIAMVIVAVIVIVVVIVAIIVVVVLM